MSLSIAVFDIRTYSKKDYLIFLALISSLPGVAFMTIASASYINAATNNTISTNNNSAITSATDLITKILAKNLENHLQKAGALLEITSKLPQVRNVSYAHFLNQTLDTLHGIPQQADIENRQVGKNILSSTKCFR